MDVRISSNGTTSDTESNPDLLFLIFKCAILIVTLLVGLPGNVWVCWVVFRTKCLQTSNNALLVSLAASDLLKCSVDAPLLLASFVRSVEGNQFPVSVCALQQFIWALCSCVQLLTLASISVERYQAISFPFQTERRKARVRLWILFIWLCGLILALIALILSKQSLFDAHCRSPVSPRDGHSDPFGAYVLVPTWVLSLTVIVIHYGRIIKLVRQHRKKVFSRGIRVMPTVSGQVWSWLGEPVSAPRSAAPLAPRRVVHSVSGESGSVAGRARRTLPEIVGAVCLRTPGARERGKKQVEGKLAKRFGYIIIAFTLFWLPMVVILLMKHLITGPDTDRLAQGAAFLSLLLTDDDIEVSQGSDNDQSWLSFGKQLLLEMETSAMVLTCLQAAVDPLIYTLVTRQFRYELGKIFLSIRNCSLKSVH